MEKLVMVQTSVTSCRAEALRLGRDGGTKDVILDLE